MAKIKNKGKTSEYVYDISLDGTVVNALGMNVCSNTDGFNFKLPEENQYRYTEEHPYIGKGLSRETKEGVEYTGFKADVAEFNDLYMCDKHYSPNGINKMGLGIDEVVSSTINFSRKNYADYFPKNPYPEDVKLVGNTIKSKKMPEYISKFLAVGIRLLLQGKGQEFLEEYYNYVEKIYNYQIPLRDIATKGKIKKTLAEYKKDVQEITKAGRPKSRQAWYELAIAENLSVGNGDTIYYINTGKSKSHADVKKTKKYYTNDLFGEQQDITKEVESGYNKWKKSSEAIKDKDGKIYSIDNYAKLKYSPIFIHDEIVLNCALVPRNILDKEEDTFCSDVSEELEYNVPKYIDMFNKRITPLLVCFSKEIRPKILIDNPNNRPYFTKEECELVSGEPNKASDQDTYEQLMTMEDKEIKFWKKYNLIPPFVEECGMGKWEDILADYDRRIDEEERSGLATEKETYQNIIENISVDEIKNVIDEGELPSALLKIIEVDPESADFISLKYPGKVIGHLSDIIERMDNFLNNVSKISRALSEE